MSPEFFGINIGKQEHRKPPIKRYTPLTPARPPPHRSRPPEHRSPIKRPETSVQRKAREARNKLAITIGIIGVVTGVTGVVVGPKIADVIRQPVNPITELKPTPDSSVIDVASATTEQKRQLNFTALPTAISARETPTPAQREKPTSATVTVKPTERVVLATPTSDVINIPEPTPLNCRPIPDVSQAIEKLNYGQKPKIITYDQLSAGQLAAVREQTKGILPGLLGINEAPNTVTFARGKISPILNTGNPFLDRLFNENTNNVATTTLNYNLRDEGLAIGSNSKFLNGELLTYDPQSNTLILTVYQGENPYYYSIPNASNYNIQIPSATQAEIDFDGNKDRSQLSFIDPVDKQTLRLNPNPLGQPFTITMGKRIDEMLRIKEKNGNRKLTVHVNTAIGFTSINAKLIPGQDFPFAMLSTEDSVALLAEPLNNIDLLPPLDGAALEKIINSGGGTQKIDWLTAILPSFDKRARVKWQTLEDITNNQPAKFKIGDIQLEVPKTRITSKETTTIIAKVISDIDDSERHFDLTFGQDKSAVETAWNQSVPLKNIPNGSIFVIPVTRNNGQKAYLMLQYFPENDHANSDLLLKFVLIDQKEAPVSQSLGTARTFTPFPSQYYNTTDRSGKRYTLFMPDDSEVGPAHDLNLARIQTRLKNASAIDRVAKAHQEQVKIEARLGSTKAKI